MGKRSVFREWFIVLVGIVALGALASTIVILTGYRPLLL